LPTLIESVHCGQGEAGGFEDSFLGGVLSDPGETLTIKLSFKKSTIRVAVRKGIGVSEEKGIQNFRKKKGRNGRPTTEGINGGDRRRKKEHTEENQP